MAFFSPCVLLLLSLQFVAAAIRLAPMQLENAHWDMFLCTAIGYLQLTPEQPLPRLLLVHAIRIMLATHVHMHAIFVVCS